MTDADEPEAPCPQRFAERELTEDRLLDGQVRLLQPIRGYRVSMDAVLLAAACPARARERVLDVGCGAGGAALCLARRVAGVALEGVELQPAYAALARRNGLLNGVVWLVHDGDIAKAPLFLRATLYDHVISNPPYFEAGAGGVSDAPGRDLANRETMPLGRWIDFCLKRLKPKGVLTLVHRAERLGAILSALEGRAGGVRVCPIWPRAGAAARRVLVRAVKESRTPLALAPGLTLHDGPEGRGGAPFTEAARAVAVGGAALDF